MTIWIDLANSPQVLFFRPIIRELEARGHTLRITSRPFAQTTELATAYGLNHEPIGRHGGRSIAGALGANFQRAVDLCRWVKRGQAIDLALSHNSYSQAVAALWLRRPLVTLMDYEHQPLNHLCFRLARRVIVPEVFPEASLRNAGAGRRARRYRGVKEQVYLSDFVPSATFLKDSGLPSDKVLVVMRPPGPWAAYHRFENDLFDQVVEVAASEPNVFIVFSPRIREQEDAMRSRNISNLHILDKALDGPNLLYHADAVISGGGTMNREAAVLGTSAYTVFKGRMPEVDRYLIESGRMVQLSTIDDIHQLQLRKRIVRPPPMPGGGLVRQITDMILEGTQHAA